MSIRGRSCSLDNVSSQITESVLEELVDQALGRKLLPSVSTTLKIVRLSSLPSLLAVLSSPRILYRPEPEGDLWLIVLSDNLYGFHRFLSTPCPRKAKGG